MESVRVLGSICFCIDQIFLQVTPSAHMKMLPVGTGAFAWQSYNEKTPASEDTDTLAMNGLYEQLNVTKDWSDYLWYLTE